MLFAENYSSRLRSRIWEMQTQVYDISGKVRINLECLYKRLDHLVNIGVLINYARIIHDRDRYTEEEVREAEAEVKNGIRKHFIEVGELKPEHIHCCLQFKEAITLSAVARKLGVNELMVRYIRENKLGEEQTFSDICAYLCHERHPDKVLYPYDKVACTFDYGEMMYKYARRQIRKKRISNRINGVVSAEFKREHLNMMAAGKENISGFISKFGYDAYEANKKHYDNAVEYYMKTRYQGEGFRLTYLITGPSTVGKTPLAKFLACSIFKEIENPRDVFFCTGDSGATLQSYNGQPVIIWDDYRATDFIQAFQRKVVFNSLFAVHPDPVDFNIKYGCTVLRHTLNIITCINDINKFTKELVGEYKDKYGYIHSSEDDHVLQAYKRIWGLSEITEEDINFQVNTGYYKNSDDMPSSYYYRQYKKLAVISNNTRELAEKYSCNLYGEIGSAMLPEVKQEYDKQKAKQLCKISRLEDFDASVINRKVTDGNEVVTY